MSNPCAKFHHDMTADNGINCIFHVFCFLYIWTTDRAISTMTSLSMTALILCKAFVMFELRLCWSILVQNFIGFPKKKENLNMSKKPSPIRINKRTECFHFCSILST